MLNGVTLVVGYRSQDIQRVVPSSPSMVTVPLVDRERVLLRTVIALFKKTSRGEAVEPIGESSLGLWWNKPSGTTRFMPWQD